MTTVRIVDDDDAFAEVLRDDLAMDGIRAVRVPFPTTSTRSFNGR